MDDPSVSRSDDEEWSPDTTDTTAPLPPPPPPTLTQILTNENNILNVSDDQTTQADLQEALKKFANSMPFILLLTLRFLLAYVAKFFSLLIINILQYRIHYILDEQISLKSSTSRNTLWTLLIVSLGLLSLIYLVFPPLLDINVVERLSFASFHPKTHDFISIIMLCYFSDSTLRILVCTVKIVLYFLLNPRGTATDHSTSTPFPNLTCMHWDRLPVFASLTPRGITDGLLSLISQRNATRLRDSNGDLASLHSHSGGSEGGGGDESDLESGPLLSSTGSGGTGGGRRRHIHSASREGLGVQGRERASSTSSVASLSAAESSDHQSEVMSFMILKKIFAALDSICAVYRSLLPMPVWVYYFTSGPGSDVLPFCYLFVKTMIIIDQSALAFKATKSIVIDQLEFGSYSTEEELLQAGSPHCSVCFDAYYRPITLSCNHIFCQHCIYEWLDHENSCPVCRAEVSRDESSKNIRNLSASAIPVIM